MHAPTVRVARELYRHVSLRLVALRGTRALGSAGIENRRREWTAGQIRAEDLMAMNVSGENGCEAARDRAAGNHVRMPAEDIARRTDRCPLDGLMKTKKTKRGWNRSPSTLLDPRGERSVDSVALARKPRDRDIDAAEAQCNRSRAIEDVDAGMHGEEWIRNRGSLMIPGHDEDGHASVRDALERLERAHDQSGLDSTPEEHVPAVNDQIHFARERRTQGAFITGEEVPAA